ncbi:DUF2812 domain-containing protein [Paenibacillus albiflavus]|uniref:DUF2812 domain-containing protein n=1 Tax=Paenibacillus albiflavus TaxID=2545760 RepID=A0A4R4DZI6_9BACL|nr:DUF2812 domain-containing protein [Paenibacillus albiflavus]TCZ69673.1 DUF2812 domain-containing protein [Paenibacillus albiflavus]
MRKFKFFLDFDKEEKWLNEMSGQGYKLVSSSFGYEFDPGLPEEANIRIDYREFKNQESFEDYRALYEDSGWLHIAGTKNSRTQYFKQMAGCTSDDIFSDVESKAARYERIARIWLSLLACYAPILIALWTTHSIHFSAVLNPKVVYFTPGLWDKTGLSFVGAFLFETPFALFRMMPAIVFPLFIFLSLIYWFKARMQYRRTMRHRV